MLGGGRLLADADSKPALRLGLVTDLHYADKQPAGTRHYRESLPKLAEAVEKFAAAKVDFVVELGDLIDAASTVETELGYLATINKTFSSLACPRYYVLGNHCVDMLTKDEFLAGIERKSSYYSFDAGPAHFVVLDACFTSDGKPYGRKNSKWTDANIPRDELDWLAADLKKTALPTIVLAHQRLDIGGAHVVRNAAYVRTLLASSGMVQAVFQGHSHKNDYQEIDGIHYCTLVAMVEGSGETSSGYSTLEMFPSGDLRLTGFRHQASRDWKPRRV